MQTYWIYGNITYASLFAPTYPPSPIEMAPAASSASPPSTTTLVFPSADRPALSAKGTVRPSERPRMASETTRGLMRARVLLPLLLELSGLAQRPKVSYDRPLCDSMSGLESPRIVSSSSMRASRGLPGGMKSEHVRLSLFLCFLYSCCCLSTYPNVFLIPGWGTASA